MTVSQPSRKRRRRRNDVMNYVHNGPFHPAVELTKYDAPIPMLGGVRVDPAVVEKYGTEARAPKPRRRRRGGKRS